MYWVGFTLGLFGSLHCIGMCGPLAIAFAQKGHQSPWAKFWSSFSYNFGRTITYTAFGLVFGLLGTLMVMVELQKAISIGLGAVLVLVFLFSVDLDGWINSRGPLKKYYQWVHHFMATFLSKAQTKPPIVLGLLNGLLPCGLVYLALAGSLATGNLYTGMVFMMAFGLGTIPAMLGLTMGFQSIPFKWRTYFRKVLPFVTLALGFFLIYRGIVVDVPLELNFWEAVKNPVMCH